MSCCSPAAAQSESSQNRSDNEDASVEESSQNSVSSDSDSESDDKKPTKPRKKSGGEIMTLESSLIEPRFVSYCSSIFGAPTTHCLLEGVPLGFDSAEELNSMLNSKAPAAWRSVRTKHIYVYRSNERRKELGWFDGKDGTTESDLEFETYLYVVVYVKPTDAKSELVASHDKRRLVHMHHATATTLFARFCALTTLNADRRDELKPLFKWKDPKSPQIKPDVAGW